MLVILSFYLSYPVLIILIKFMFIVVQFYPISYHLELVAKSSWLLLEAWVEMAFQLLLDFDFVRDQNPITHSDLKMGFWWVFETGFSMLLHLNFKSIYPCFIILMTTINSFAIGGACCPVITLYLPYVRIYNLVFKIINFHFILF